MTLKCMLYKKPWGTMALTTNVQLYDTCFHLTWSLKHQLKTSTSLSVNKLPFTFNHWNQVMSNYFCGLYKKKLLWVGVYIITDLFNTPHPAETPSVVCKLESSCCLVNCAWVSQSWAWTEEKVKSLKVDAFWLVLVCPLPPTHLPIKDCDVWLSTLSLLSRNWRYFCCWPQT